MSIKKGVIRTAKPLIPKNNSKISLFLVGAQKAGTSALHDYLIKHPKVIGGKKKEINFFNHDENFRSGYSWYHQQFQRPLFYKGRKFFIDSTPQYLSDKHSAERIYEYNPEAFIIILLRNPVSRAFSAWNMYRQFSKLPLERKKKLISRHIDSENQKNFFELISQTPFPEFSNFVNNEIQENSILDYYPNIIEKGLYFKQIETYLNVFNERKIMVFESDDFRKNKLKVTNQIFENLSLEKINIPENELTFVNKREYTGSMNEDILTKLKLFYKPYNDQLFKLLGKEFNWD